MLVRKSGRVSRLLASLRATGCSALAGKDGPPLLAPLQKDAGIHAHAFIASAETTVSPASSGGGSGASAACTPGNSSSSSSSPLCAVPQGWRTRARQAASSDTLGPSSRRRWLSSSSAEGNADASAAAVCHAGSASGAHAAPAAAGGSPSAGEAAPAARQAAPEEAGAAAGAAAAGGAAAAAAGAGGGAATLPYQGPLSAGWQQVRVWPRPPRDPFEAMPTTFPRGAEELVALEFLQTRVGRARPRLPCLPARLAGSWPPPRLPAPAAAQPAGPATTTDVQQAACMTARMARCGTCASAVLCLIAPHGCPCRWPAGTHEPG